MKISNTLFDEKTKKNIESWLDDSYDEETRKTIHKLMDESPELLSDAFYTHLQFGTGGMRGLMGIGCNRINLYTIQMATQGLANYILKQPLQNNGSHHKVMIGYDSRTNSKEFAEEAAKVLAGNQIEAHLFEELRPTPLVSFGCRLRGCTAGIMITASHNPKEYNGYKVYWNDGAQVLPPHDAGIIDEVYKINSPKEVKKAPKLDHPLIVKERDEIDAAYLAAIAPLQLYAESNHQHGNQLKIFYTPLHGTGITLVPKALKLWGFTNVTLVKEQSVPNGLFPTVTYPNPEESSALELGIKALKKNHGDILLATDPDADRVGLAILHEEKVHLFTGNQIACLCLHHILKALSDQKRIPKRGACVKTVTTTELFAAIAKNFSIECFDVLTGFKYIAEKIREWENDPSKGYTFLFGGEDSYGYLYGTHSRDKDAVIICLLLSEIALQAKLKGKTILDLLNDLYKEYGYYLESLVSINFPDTKEGKERSEKVMVKLRENPPSQFQEYKTLVLEDYKKKSKTILKSGETIPLLLPVSNVLIFRLENDGKIIIRPSGTESKIKIYVFLKNATQEKMDSLINELRKILS